MLKDITEALSRIDPDCSYDEWLTIGMSLKQAGESMAVWDSWSRGGRKYPGYEAIERKWNTFSNDHSTPVTIKSLFGIAKTYGYHPAKMETETGLDDNPDNYFSLSDIIAEYEVSPESQFKNYVRSLYRSGEHINIVQATKISDNSGNVKFLPIGQGSNIAVDDVINASEAEIKRKYIDPLNISGGGGWICINPVKADSGRKNSDVTDYRYVLVESDSMQIERQEAFYRQHNFPIKALVYSGSKSLHAVVCVDAPNLEEYKKRVAILYKYLEENGFKADSANKNPARLTRLPGLKRNGILQRLVDTQIGCKSWNEWLTKANNNDGDNYPTVETLDLVNKPPLPEAIIDGILRRGHKMLLSGSSKAGKSFLLMELAVAFAEGTKWLSFQCKQGRVLYVNLEIDRASCIDRFDKIYTAMKLKKEHVSNIDVWNLRGFAAPLNLLAPKIIRQMLDRNYIAVIFDPIYKIIMGDENNASEMGAFCNQFDHIAEETKCAVIYCHHHSKGAQGAKKAQDRASGSGVFSRDPDAQLDIIELEIPDEQRERIGFEQTGWRMESCLREFANIYPTDFWFRYPIHFLDTTGILRSLYAAGNEKKKADLRKCTDRTKYNALKTTLEDVENQIAVMLGHDGRNEISVTEVSEALNCSEKTIYRKLSESKTYKIYGKNIILR